MRRSRKPFGPQPGSRGFESPLLRQVTFCRHGNRACFIFAWTKLGGFEPMRSIRVKKTAQWAVFSESRGGFSRRGEAREARFRIPLLRQVTSCRHGNRACFYFVSTIAILACSINPEFRRHIQYAQENRRYARSHAPLAILCKKTQAVRDAHASNLPVNSSSHVNLAAKEDSPRC